LDGGIVHWRLTALSGTCVHVGYAVGRVVVAGRGDVPTAGAVLVARALDPLDVPLVFDCEALILEEGGPTSHAAIAAAELGIPSLTDVIGAASVLASGERVFVDASRGRIMRLDDANGCPFCDPTETPELLGGSRLRVIEDAFPIVDGHTLVVPRRHISDPDDLEDADWVEFAELLTQLRRSHSNRNGSRDLNVLLNAGPAAGQTIDHLHWHVLPRRRGDDPDPRGGLRRVISEPLCPYPTPDFQ